MAPESAPTRPRLPIWMRHRGVLFAALLLLVSAPAAARADGRSIQIGLFAGGRSFEDRLDLTSEVAAGARVGMDWSKHASLLMDVVYTTPTRKGSGAFTRVISVRSLIQYRCLTGPLRPYVVAGLGGTLFDFEDTPDAAGGTLTGGVGMEWRLARRIAVFGEGSIDWYRSRAVTYAPTGERLTISDRTTDAVRTFGAGLVARF